MEIGKWQDDTCTLFAAEEPLEHSDPLSESGPE